VAALITAGAFAGGGAFAQGHPQPHPAPKAADGSVTINIQGDNTDWWESPFMHQGYGAALQALANGPDRVDRAAFQATFMKLAHAFALSMNMDPKGMQDHLKLIPGQIVDIVRDDPKALDSYENFVLAMRGPA
jgi:hypothetical protein